MPQCLQMTSAEYANADMMVRLRIPQPTPPVPIGFSITTRNCTTSCGPGNATITLNTTQVLSRLVNKALGGNTAI